VIDSLCKPYQFYCIQRAGPYLQVKIVFAPWSRCALLLSLFFLKVAFVLDPNYESLAHLRVVYLIEYLIYWNTALLKPSTYWHEWILLFRFRCSLSLLKSIFESSKYYQYKYYIRVFHLQCGATQFEYDCTCIQLFELINDLYYRSF
jgi:hypothetical protein